MMTPQEAESHVFSKASFSGGYNMAQVDAFLDILLPDYGALYKENAALKSKMKVLVDKIEEYRSTEDAMRMTLLSAQKMADSMIKEAETKKVEAMAQTDAEARARTEQIMRELQNEELRLAAARNSTAAYVTRLREMYTKELEYLSRLSEMTMGQAQPPVQEEPVRQEENADAISRLTHAQLEPLDAVPLPVPEEEAAEEPVPVPAAPEEGSAEQGSVDDDTMIFDRLQFGKDYDFE